MNNRGKYVHRCCNDCGELGKIAREQFKKWKPTTKKPLLFIVVAMIVENWEKLLESN